MDAPLAPAALATSTFDHQVATITMNDPRRRNALGTRMLADLSSCLAQATAHHARAIILRAAPDHTVWCAGFDINELHPGLDPLAQDGPLQTLFHAIADCPAPVIAMLHGTAWGGGTDLALRCDIAIADPTCTLAFTPARLGLPYDPEGLLNVMLRAGMNLAMEMFATADPIPAQRAHTAGLLNHLVPEQDLEPFTQAMAQRIAANAPLSVTSAKRQLRALNAAMPLPTALLQSLLDQRNKALASEDYQEGRAAFTQKRPPTFQGR